MGLKLEGETESMGVCTKERKGVTAAVLMATPLCEKDFFCFRRGERFGGSLAVTESDSLQAGRQDCPGPFEQWAEGTVGDATRSETCMLETR